MKNGHKQQQHEEISKSKNMSEEKELNQSMLRQRHSAATDIIAVETRSSNSANSAPLLTNSTTFMEKPIAADAKNLSKNNKTLLDLGDANRELVGGKGNVHKFPPSSSPQIPTPSLTSGVLPKKERMNYPNVGGDQSNRVVVGVFDGHGGDQVAKYLRDTIPEEIDKIKNNLNKKTLTRLMMDLDRKYFEQEENTDLKAIGSTSLFAVITPPSVPKGCFSFRKKKHANQYQIDVVHVGDSRCIIWSGKEKKFEQVTRDHRPDDQIELQRIQKAEGLVLEGRVDGKISVTRTIGDWPLKKDPTRSPENQKLIAVPDVEKRFASEGDFVLIACDGIFEKLNSERVVEIIEKSLEEKRDPSIALVELLDAAQESGSTDNMTAILILLEDGSSYHRETPEFDVGRLFVDDRMFLQFGVKFARAYGFEKEFKEAVEKEKEALFLRKKDGGDAKIDGSMWDGMEDEQEASFTFESHRDFADDGVHVHQTPKRTHDIPEEEEEDDDDDEFELNEH